MADSSNQSQGKKENTREGSSIGDETINNERRGSRSIAVPPSPNQPQVSMIGGSSGAADGDEEAGVCGGSETKREDQAFELLVGRVDKGKAVMSPTKEHEQELGLLYMEKLQMMKPNFNFDGSVVLIPCSVCGKRFSHRAFFRHLLAHPGWNPDGKFLPLAAFPMAALTHKRIGELEQELPLTLLSIGLKILEQIASSGEGPSMQHGNTSDESEDDAFDPGF